MTRMDVLARSPFSVSKVSVCKFSVTMALVVAAGCAAPALGGPEGEQVRQGSVRFTRDGAGNTVLAEAEEWAPAADVALENRVEAARRWVGLLNIKQALLVRLEADSRLLARSD